MPRRRDGGSAKPFVADWRDAVRDSSLRSSVKCVALVLSTYYPDVWPSITTLSRGASVARRSTLAAIEKLERVGFLDVRRGRGRAVNHYALRYP